MPFTGETCDSEGNVVSDGLIVDCGNGAVLDVWTSDSGNWIEWHWKGDHYEMVGGTRAQRTDWPSGGQPRATTTLAEGREPTAVDR